MENSFNYMEKLMWTQTYTYRKIYKPLNIIITHTQLATVYDIDKVCVYGKVN